MMYVVMEALLVHEAPADLYAPALKNTIRLNSV